MATDKAPGYRPDNRQHPLAIARRFLRRLLPDNRGVAALEFALVAPVFTLIFVGITEMAAVLYFNTMLEGAASDAARLIRTGQLQKEADPLAAFRSSFCSSMLGLVDCSKVSFEVKNFASFTASDVEIVLDEDGNVETPVFTPGGAEEITFVRVTYRYEFFTPLIGQLMTDNGTNSALLVSTAVFQNEPYEAVT